MTRRHTLSASFVLPALFATLCAAPAAADVIPMDVTACDMHTVGSACTDDMGMGVCTMSTCTRLDYANWNQDASATPPSVTYDCVRCIVGGSSDAGSVTSDAGSAPARPTSSCSAAHARTDGAWWIASLALVLPLAFVRRRPR